MKFAKKPHRHKVKQQTERDEPGIMTLPSGEEVLTQKGEAAFLEGLASILLCME